MTGVVKPRRRRLRVRLRYHAGFLSNLLTTGFSWRSRFGQDRTGSPA